MALIFKNVNLLLMWASLRVQTIEYINDWMNEWIILTIVVMITIYITCHVVEIIQLKKKWQHDI